MTRQVEKDRKNVLIGKTNKMRLLSKPRFASYIEKRNFVGNSCKKKCQV